MNILIIGSENSIANQLKRALISEHNILQFGDENNITNRISVAKVIGALKPDIVICDHFLKDVDACEANESLAYKINAVASLNIAYACSTIDIPIISLSTSYVYHGDQETPYKETDPCTPINVYGKTMLAGERLIKTLCKKYFILRTSWIFGRPDCLVKKIIKNNDIPLFMCSKELGNPTFIDDISLTIKNILKTESYGVYNCASPYPIAKCQWVQEILRKLNIEKEIFELPENILKNTAPRPKFAALDVSLLQDTFDFQIKDWRVSLKDYINSMGALK